MKKLIEYLILIFPILFFLQISILLFDNWEFRVPWLTSYILISSTIFSLFFITFLSYKSLRELNAKWLRIWTISLTIIIGTIIYVFRHNDFPLPLIFGILLLSILVVYFIKSFKWKRIILLTHSSILTVLMLIFLITVAFDSSNDHVINDLQTLYISKDGKKKVIIQNSSGEHRKYLISNDLGIIRKKIPFDGVLADGSWYILNKKDQKIAEISIENGIETNRENILNEKNIIISSIDDIQKNSTKENMTLVIDGLFTFNHPIVLENCKDLTLEAMHTKNNAELHSINYPCLIIKKSNNITIEDLKLSSTNSSATIIIENSDNVTIKNSAIYSNNTDIGIDIDSFASNISLKKNQFIGQNVNSVKGFTYNTLLNQNIHFTLMKTTIMKKPFFIMIDNTI